jgi:hypothetical protein
LQVFCEQVQVALMRVLITKRLSGSIDGIQLNAFVTGQVYGVSTSLASYLMCERWAEPVADDSPARVVPLNDVRSMWTTADRSAGRAEGDERSKRRAM